MSLILPFFIICALSMAAVLLSWVYFRRWRIMRPPIGVIGVWDVSMVLGGIIIVPYLYLLLPRWLVGGMLTTGGLSALYFFWEPVLPRVWQRLAVVSILGGADFVCAARLASAAPLFLPVNDVALVLVIGAVANLWAQGGLKARHAALLAGCLACYDLAATGLLPITGDLVTRVSGLPFQPMLAWPLGSSEARVAIGMGDVLFSSMFPLVMRKAFGRRAGLAAIAAELVLLGLLFAALAAWRPDHVLPVMVLLGPLMILQYAYWHRRTAGERTTWQYLQAEPTR